MRELKKILNFSEALTDRRLQEAAARNGARVFAKVRVGDVLPIENSGLPESLFGYALRAHFDFIVANDDHTPLFAVEFDGPLHEGVEASERDEQKGALCERFGLPILRINSRYLDARYRGMDLLTWTVEHWFASEQIAAVQASGALPQDEYFDPALMVSIPGLSGTFPLWLSREPLLFLQALHREGKTVDRVPAEWIGLDERGNARAVGAFRLTESDGVLVRTAMRAQQFPISPSDFLSEVIVFDVAEGVRRTLGGEQHPVPTTDIDAAFAEYQARYELLSAMYAGSGRHAI